MKLSIKESCVPSINILKTSPVSDLRSEIFVCVCVCVKFCLTFEQVCGLQLLSKHILDLCFYLG